MDVVIILGVIEMGVVKWVDGRGDIWVVIEMGVVKWVMDVVVIIISTCFAGLDVANWVVEK